MSAKAIALAARYGRKSDLVEIWQDIIDERYMIPAYDEPDYPVVTTDDHLQVMKWGLIPHRTADADQARDIMKRNLYKNARAETIFETWPYKFVVRRQRCLIPSTGYFEYHYAPEHKYAQPYYLYLPGQEIFSMAGIYDTWTDPESGRILTTFTQLTTGANDLARRIHNGGKNPYRMPVILRRNDEQRWLDPDLPRDDIMMLTAPYPSDKMDAYPVARGFRDMDPHDPSIIRRVQL